MAVLPVPLAMVNLCRQSYVDGIADCDVWITLYNPVTGEYLGTEAQTRAHKNFVMAVCNVNPYRIGVDIACYPTGIGSLVFLPIDP